MKVKEIAPRMFILEYRQEKGDKDYGLCLWARFAFNLDRYELSITSDCGNYGHKWVETPDSESFLELMARCDGGYILNKIYGSPDIFDFDKTKERIYEDFGYDEEHKEALDDIFDNMDIYGQSETAEGFLRCFEDCDEYDVFCDVWETLQFVYPPNALKIVDVFETAIKPYIKKKLEGN